MNNREKLKQLVLQAKSDDNKYVTSYKNLLRTENAYANGIKNTMGITDDIPDNPLVARYINRERIVEILISKLTEIRQHRNRGQVNNT